MNLPEIEQKLLRLALDRAAHDGEVASAAGKLMNLWRKRAVTVETVLNGQAAPPRDSSSFDNRAIKTLEAQLEAERIKCRNFGYKIHSLKAEVERLQGLVGIAPGHNPSPEQEKPSLEAARAFKMPFGKHKGKPLSEIEWGYLAWVLENTKGWEELKAHIRVILGK